LGLEKWGALQLIGVARLPPTGIRVRNELAKFSAIVLDIEMSPPTIIAKKCPKFHKNCHVRPN
jgi:hypothetical protein